MTPLSFYPKDSGRVERKEARGARKQNLTDLHRGQDSEKRLHCGFVRVTLTKTKPFFSNLVESAGDGLAVTTKPTKGPVVILFLIYAYRCGMALSGTITRFETLTHISVHTIKRLTR